MNHLLPPGVGKRVILCLLKTRKPEGNVKGDVVLELVAECCFLWFPSMQCSVEEGRAVLGIGGLSCVL